MKGLYFGESIRLLFDVARFASACDISDSTFLYVRNKVAIFSISTEHLSNSCRFTLHELVIRDSDLFPFRFSITVTFLHSFCLCNCGKQIWINGLHRTDIFQ